MPFPFAWWTLFPEADYTLDDSFWNEESPVGKFWSAHKSISVARFAVHCTSDRLRAWHRTKFHILPSCHCRWRSTACFCVVLVTLPVLSIASPLISRWQVGVKSFSSPAGGVPPKTLTSHPTPSSLVRMLSSAQRGDKVPRFTCQLGASASCVA